MCIISYIHCNNIIKYLWIANTGDWNLMYYIQLFSIIYIYITFTKQTHAVLMLLLFGNNPYIRLSGFKWSSKIHSVFF